MRNVSPSTTVCADAGTVSMSASRIAAANFIAAHCADRMGREHGGDVSIVRGRVVLKIWPKRTAYDSTLRIMQDHPTAKSASFVFLLLSAAASQRGLCP